MKTELLPCPLCQSTNVQPGTCYVDNSSTREDAARCGDCGCRATKRAWQSRVQPQSPSGIIEKASEILRRRAAGYEARHTSIFNGRIMADELKANAREIEALADTRPLRTEPHLTTPQESET
jgi:hypothetical protein